MKYSGNMKTAKSRKSTNSFMRLKMGVGMTVLFAVMAFTSPLISETDTGIWFDLMKITIGFTLGSSISTGYSD